VAFLVQIQRSTVDTLPFLDLLLVATAEELLHRILQIDGFGVAAHVVGAVLVLGGDVAVHGGSFRLDEVVVLILSHLLLIIFFLMLFLVPWIFFLVILVVI